MAIRTISVKGDIKTSLTYAQIWENTGILASHYLKEGLKPQDRVLIVYPITAVLEYVTAFIACLRIGVTPVSIYPPNPSKLEQDLKKFAVFIENAKCDKAITTAEYKRFVTLSSLTTKWPPGIIKWLATDSLVKKRVKVDSSSLVHQAAKEDIAFIQYTSGSTGFIFVLFITSHRQSQRSSSSPSFISFKPQDLSTYFLKSYTRTSSISYLVAVLSCTARPVNFF